jgi:hypothetical protein
MQAKNVAVAFALIALLLPWTALPTHADSAVARNSWFYDTQGQSAIWDDGGHAYTFGGTSGLYSFYISKYTPATNAVTDTGVYLPSARVSTSAVWDGYSAYVMGGFDYSAVLSQIVRYTPSTNTVTTLAATLPVPMYAMSAVWDGTGNAYLFGGVDASGTPQSRIVRFTPSTGLATTLPSTLPTARSHTSAVWDGAGNAYIFGGNEANGGVTGQIVRFTPATGAVSVVASLPYGRSSSAAVWDGDGRAYVFGGWRPDYSSTGTTLTDIVRYIPDSGRVETMGATLPSRRSGSVAVWDRAWEAAYIFGGAPSTYNQGGGIVVYTRWTPPAPVDFHANAGPGGGEITLDWAAPPNDGGVPITGYEVQRNSGTGDRPVTSGGCANLGPSARGCTDSGLANGAQFWYTVAAINDLGIGTPTAYAGATTFNTPSAPTGLAAASGNAGADGVDVHLTWHAPSSNGGAAVTNYRLDRTYHETESRVLGNVLSYDDHCTVGATCYYTVRAINAAGPGAPSNEVFYRGTSSPVTGLNPPVPYSALASVPPMPDMPAVTMPSTDGRGYVVVPWGEQPIVRDVPAPDTSGRVAILFFLTGLPDGSGSGYATLRALDPFGAVLYSKQDEVFFEDGHTSSGFAYFEAIPTQGVANLQVSYGGVTSDVTVDRQVPADPCKDPDGCLPCESPCDPQACNVLDEVPGFCDSPDPGTDPCDEPALQNGPPCRPPGPIDPCDRVPATPVLCRELQPLCPDGLKDCICGSQPESSAMMSSNLACECLESSQDCPSPCANGSCDPCHLSDIDCADPGCDGLAERVCRIITPDTSLCAAPSCHTIPVPLTETTASGSSGGCGTVIDSGTSVRSEEQRDDQHAGRQDASELNYTRIDWARKVTYTNSCDHSEGGSALLGMGMQWSGPKYGMIGYEYPLHAGFVYHGASIYCGSQDYGENGFSTCTPQANHQLWVRPEVWALIPPGQANFTFLDVATLTLNGHDGDFKGATYCDPYVGNALIAFNAMGTLTGMALKGPFALAWGEGQSLFSDWATKEGCSLKGFNEMPWSTFEGHRIGNGLSVAPKFKQGISIEEQKEAQARVMVISKTCTTEGFDFLAGASSEWSIEAHTLYSTESSKPAKDTVWTSGHLDMIPTGADCTT